MPIETRDKKIDARTTEEIKNKLNELKILKNMKSMSQVIEHLIITEHSRLTKNKPLPLIEWHEDMGDMLWWFFPIQEPPYCGTPLDCDFPDYVTHFTKFTYPGEEG